MDDYPRSSHPQIRTRQSVYRFRSRERAGQKIAVEVKSFLKNSAVSEFHTALGQFISYRILLAEQYPEYVLYLAVPMDTYTSFFATQLAQGIIQSQQLKLIVYKPQQEVIEQWLT